MALRLVSIDPSIVNAPGYLMAGNAYLVGRSKTCEFLVSDHSVSRSHAQVIVNQDSVIVKDMGSTNGTYVNDKLVEQASVQPGQPIRFGRVQFVLTTDEPVLPPPEDYSALSTIQAVAKTGEFPALKLLSEAQRRVLEVLLTGSQEKEVASKLNLSPHTVHNHVKGIYRKLKVTSRPELLALFVGDGKPSKK